MTRGPRPPRLWSYLLLDLAGFGAVVILVSCRSTRYWLPTHIRESQSDIYVAMSAVGATLLGFMVAAFTILLTLTGGARTDRFIKSVLYAKTLALFHATAVWLAIATTAAIVGLFVDHAPLPEQHLHATNLWIWILLGSTAIAAWRFFYGLVILRDVIDVVAGDRRSRRPDVLKERPTMDDLTRGD